MKEILAVMYLHNVIVIDHATCYTSSHMHLYMRNYRFNPNIYNV